MHYLEVSPHDPLIARDGRPFGVGQGQRMRSLDWPYPSVVTGSLRTLLGKRTDPTFCPETVKALEALSIAGPLPMATNTLFLPQPQDAPVREEDCRCFGIRPAVPRGEEGGDLPNGLRPVLLPDSVDDDFKPAKVPAFWSREKVAQWLLNPTGDGFSVPLAKDCKDEAFLNAPERDVRFHIRMDPDTGAGRTEDALFMTAGLDLSRPRSPNPVCLSIRVTASDGFSVALQGLDALHPLGGERRLAHWRSADTGKLWDCPESIQAALASAPRVRMMLATPGLFNDGWKPGWLHQGDHGLEGTVPHLDVRLRLVGVTINRWQPLSGWSLKEPVGPKPIRRLVPAGGVYFFEVADGAPENLAQGWLQSVCDEPQDQRDGFGLALWGIWDEHNSVGEGA